MREAVRGSSRDFTDGAIRGLGIFLAVPMILEMSMESLFAVVDTFFVAKLGADAVAIVGLTESVMVLIYAVASGLRSARRRRLPAGQAKRMPRGRKVGRPRHLLVASPFRSLSAQEDHFCPQILTLLGAKPHILAVRNLCGSWSVVMRRAIHILLNGDLSRSR
ncbi:MAG: hypothetical protein IPK98_17045 [Chloracidobacterium sp.]|nr:hypothetical protein [Chloracidobacterium sp.]